MLGSEGKDKVVEVRPGDGQTQLNKVGEVKRIMDQEMGFTPLAEGEKVLRTREKAFLYVREKRVIGCVITEKIESAYPVIQEKDENEKDRNDGTAIGAAASGVMGNVPLLFSSSTSSGSSSTTITTSSSSIISPPVPSKRPKLESAAGKGSDVATKLLPKGVAYSLTDPREARLGIKQIWVSKDARRQGIARKLAEVARTRFYYGFLVPRDKVAFSQLSNAGHAFGQAYMDGHGRLLVY